MIVYPHDMDGDEHVEHAPGTRPGEKIIVVEGKTDEEQLKTVLTEPVSFVRTSGTLSYETMEESIVPLQGANVFILVDADKPGMKLRNQLKQELPNAKHLYTTRVYREVARTPLSYLAKILLNAHFEVDETLLEDENSNPT